MDINNLEIEQMKNIIENSSGVGWDYECGTIARDLAKHGIGNVRNAVKDFMERVLIICERSTETISDFINIDDQVRALFTELYGEDK